MVGRREASARRSSLSDGIADWQYQPNGADGLWLARRWIPSILLRVPGARLASVPGCGGLALQDTGMKAPRTPIRSGLCVPARIFLSPSIAIEGIAMTGKRGVSLEEWPT